MRELMRRVKHWLGRRRADADLLEELELHRAITQHALQARGLSAEEAAHASRRALGNVTLAREDARGVWIWPWLESVWRDLRYAVRIAHRNRVFALAVISIMSLGMGATTGVFGLLDGLVLRSLPVRDPHRLAWFESPSFSYPIFAEVRARGSDVFSGLFAWNMERLNVRWADELDPTEVLTASGEFFSTLGISAAVGRPFGTDDDQIGGGPVGPVAIISHACWQRRFGGDASVVGRTVQIERVLFTIIGVTPPGFFGVVAGLSPDIMIPLTTLQNADALRSASSSWLHLMGRLRDGVTLERGNVALQRIWPPVLEATTSSTMPADRRALYLGRTTSLQPGRTGFSRVRNQFEEPLWMLLALVSLLMTVACASAAHLLLARGVARRREIAVRLAIGASRRRLVRQMFTEALVWTVLAAAVGLMLASSGGRMLVGMMSTWEEPIALDLSLNWRIMGFALALALLGTGLCATIPALRATRLHLVQSLKVTGSLGALLFQRRSLGRSLVAAQIALTVLLLVGAALFVRSLQRVLGQDAGFTRDNILVVSTDAVVAGYTGERLVDFYSGLRQRLEALPGVESASLSWYPPISNDMGSWTQTIALDGAPLPTPSARSSVYFNAVSPGYFHTLNIRLLHGRDFLRTDDGSTARVVVINESLGRRYFPEQSPLGRRISIGRNASRRDLEVVGVVGDVKYQRLQEPARMIAYLPHTQLSELLTGENLFAEVRTTGSIGQIAETVRQEVRLLDSGVPIRLETVTSRIRESLVRERVIAILATSLGLAALGIACAGLYGLLAYAVSGRTREIGLRLALGAERKSVLRMIVRECLAIAVVGVAIGIGASLALGRFVRSLLYQVSAHDPVSLATAAGSMLAVAVLAGLLPAYRASRIDPAVALRAE